MYLNKVVHVKIYNSIIIIIRLCFNVSNENVILDIKLACSGPY